jgi:hypothetical protein
MNSALDPNSPSIAAEYARYLDGDILGKIITRNFLLNLVGLKQAAIFIPVGRYGNAREKYLEGGVVQNDPGDGHVDIQGRRVTFEIKLARINMGNRKTGSLAENWAFVNILHTPAKAPKSYDILIAIGLRTLGLEDDRFWSHSKEVHRNLRAREIPAREDALPHEPDFLSLCSFFVVPRAEVATNYFRINVDLVDKSPHARYRAWGHDAKQCTQVWQSAVAGLPHGA